MAKFLDRWVARVDGVQQRHRRLASRVAVVKKYGDDHGGHLAALVAYYSFLALLPLFLVFVTVLGFVLDGHPALRRDLVESAVADFPVLGAQLRRNVHALGGSGLALAVGVVVLVWGSLGVAYAAQHATAELWNVPALERPGFAERLVRALLLLAVLAVGVIGTTVLTGVIASAGSGVAFDVVGVVVVLCFNAALYVAGMRVLTTASVATRDLVPGALLGGAAWTVLQLVGSWLVGRQLRHTSELYGFFGIVLGLLFWLYLTAQVFVYTSEVNVVRARRLWPRSVSGPSPTPDDDAPRESPVGATARRG